MTADRDIASAGSGDNPTSITDLIAAYRVAHDAFGAVPGATVADENTDAYQDAQRGYLVARNAVLDARPAALAECALWLRWALEDGAIRDSATGMPETIEHIAGVLEELHDQPSVVRIPPTGIEQAARDIERVSGMLADTVMMDPGEGWGRVHYLADRLEDHVAELTAFIHGAPDQEAPARIETPADAAKAFERLALIADIGDGDGDEQAAIVQSLRGYLEARS